MKSILEACDKMTIEALKAKISATTESWQLKFKSLTPTSAFTSQTEKAAPSPSLIQSQVYELSISPTATAKTLTQNQAV